MAKPFLPILNILFIYLFFIFKSIFIVDPNPFLKPNPFKFKVYKFQVLVKRLDENVIANNKGF
jgi:hypothetical protein